MMGMPAGLLPWSVAGAIAGTAVAVTLTAAALDPPRATAAAAGLAVGLGGTIMGGLGAAVAGAVLALGAVTPGFADLEPALRRWPSWPAPGARIK